MITEKKFGDWTTYRSGKSVSLFIKKTGTGAQQVISLGDGVTYLAQFLNFPVRLLKIELNFEDTDAKNVEVDKTPQFASLKTILLGLTAVTNKSLVLDAEPGNVDVIKTPFQLDFIVTYTLNKVYEITVTLDEVTT
jgi:hypothetical protein